MTSLWIGFVGLLIGAIYFGKDAIAAKGEDWEEFHIVHFTITVVAALAYLGMIMGQGRIEVYGHDVFWARYVDWAITTPLIVYSLTRLGGVRGPIIAGLLISNELMVVTGFFAAVSPPSAEYVWYIVSCFFELAVFATILGPVASAARKQHPNVSGRYNQVMWFFIAYYIAYPVVWILGDKGIGLYGTSVETLAIALLDVIAKVIYAYVLLKDKEIFKQHSNSRSAKYSYQGSIDRGSGDDYTPAPAHNLQQ